MNDRLRAILDAKRRHVETRRREVSESELANIMGRQSPPRKFAAALTRSVAQGGYGIIAEIKRASPSRGRLRDGFHPQALAQAMEAGGASCLSVLTDEQFFEGADSHLEQARESTALPVLRKDFMLDPYQILEARALGADCVLLILAALSDSDAHLLAESARELDMDVLVEVHDEEEMERAIELDPDLIGINNRNLRTFETDLSVSERLASQVPAGIDVVSESGLHGPGDLQRLADHGIRRFLIGEAFMRQADVEAAVRHLMKAGDDTP